MVALAAHPDGGERRAPEGLLLAGVLMDATGGGDARVLEVLAVALAANGQFEAAVREAERTRELVRSSPEILARVEALLQLFRAGRPYVQGEPR